MTSPFRSTAVVGAGAVGSFFGAMLARAGHPRHAHRAAGARPGDRARRAAPADGRPRRGDPHRREHRHRRGSRRRPRALLRQVDRHRAVAREMAPHLADGALVLSLQNGVENAATIARHVRQTVVPAVVYVATAMPEPGLVTHHGRGDLVIGADRREGGAGRRAGSAPAGAGRPVRERAGAGPHLGRRHGRAVVEADGELRLQRDLRDRPGELRQAGRARPGARAAGGGGARGRRARGRPKA